MHKTVTTLADLREQPEQLITAEELAAILRLAPGTIYGWRNAGNDGPPVIAAGPRCLRYRAADVLNWIEQRRSNAA